MKILTVRQPWAWAFFSAGKDVENRSRRTNYRGPLAIHVSRFSDWHEIAEDACSMYGLLRSTVLTRAELEQSIGLIIGVVDVIDCVRDSPSRWAIPEQWHWVVANPRSVHPVQIIGQLGIFERELDLEYS